MNKVRDILSRITSTIFINPRDSEIIKAKKVIWYAFIGSIFTICLVSLIILYIGTISTSRIKVPMIVGDDIYSALRKISDKKLVADVIPRFSEKIEKGIVFKQEPNQGISVRKGRTVSFFVSLGPRSDSLPDLSGYTFFELDNYLSKIYPDNKIPFSIGEIIYEFNNEKEKGKIIKQNPPEGTPLDRVKKVKLWVSNGIKDEEAQTLDDYKGKHISDVSKIMSNLEILYAYDFNIVHSKKNDGIILEQSIGKGKLIDEIQEEKKILVFKVNRYMAKKGNSIKGSYIIDIPKKPLPFMLEVKLREGTISEKTILKRQMKGGVSIPVLYSIKKDSSILVYIDNQLINTINLKIDELENK